MDLSRFDHAGQVLEHWARQRPEHPAFVLDRGTGQPTLTLTYLELLRRARARAGRLLDRVGPGGRVVLALPTGLEFVELYAACLVGGLVAVPVPAADGDRSGRAAVRLRAIVEDCGAALALVEESVAVLLGGTLADGVSCEPALPFDDLDEGPDLDEGSDGLPGPSPVGRDTLAVLQYTSGSTGDPKGVMVTHGNILANMQSLGADLGVGPDPRFGAWLPLFHDMGLFGMLTCPLMLGGTCVLMPPTAFVRRPVEWLRMMSRHRITFTAAPSFAFELCLRTVSDEHLAGLDLSSISQLCNGSEPIDVRVMTAFSQRFAAAGLAAEAMVPCYGMAESTLFTSGKPVGVAPTVLYADPAALDRGRLEPADPLAGQQVTLAGLGHPRSLEVRVVDPAGGAVLPPGEVGEVWLRGAGIAAGYWNRPEVTADTFGAATAAGETGWLRTGDLGAVLSGELYVTGRIKEMLIVRGRNLYPQDLEREARDAHPALAGLSGAAFGVASPDERVVLVHEVSPRTATADLPDVAAAVTERLAEVTGIRAGSVVLVRRGAVPRTTSGKIERAATRRAFLAGGLPVLHAQLERAVQLVLDQQQAPDRLPVLAGDPA